MAKKMKGILLLFCLLLLLMLSTVAAPVAAVAVRIDLDKTYTFKNTSVSTIRTIDLGDPAVSKVEFLTTAGDNSDIRTIQQPQINHIRRIFTTTTGTFKGNTITIEGDPDSTISYLNRPDYRIYIQTAVPTFKVTVPDKTGNPIVLKYNENWDKSDTSSLSALLDASDARYLYKINGILYQDPTNGPTASPDTGWVYDLNDVFKTLNQNIVDLNPFTALSSRSRTLGDGGSYFKADTGKYFAGAIWHNEGVSTTNIYALSPVVFLKKETPVVWTDKWGPRYLPMTYVKGEGGDVILSFGGSNPDVPTNIGYVFINSEAQYEMNVTVDTALLAQRATDRWPTLASNSPIIELLYKSIEGDVGDAYTYNLTAVGQVTPPNANSFSTIAITPGYGISANTSGTTIAIPAASFSALNNGVYYVYLMGTNGDNDVVALSQGLVSISGTPKPMPTIGSLTPTTGYQNSTVDFTLTGTNFPSEFGTSGVVVNLTKIRNTTITSTIASVTNTKITGSFSIPYNADVNGLWDLELTTQDAGTVIKSNAFTVKANLLPTISGFTPATAYRNTTVTYTVTGANFQTDSGQTSLNFTYGDDVTRLDLNRTITISSVTSTKITGTLLINSTAPVGYWNLTVKTMNGGTSLLRTNAIKVNADLLPTIASVTPALGYRNDTVSFTVNGANFQTDSGQTSLNFTYGDDATRLDLNRTITISSVTSTKITGTLLINSTAPTGNWNLTVKTMNGGTSLIRTNAINVKDYSIPTIASITATTPWYRNSTITYTIRGLNFRPGQTTVYFINQTNGNALNTTALTSETSTQIVGDIVIPHDAPLGNKWVLNISTIDSGGNGTRAGAITVLKVPTPVVGAITPNYGNKNTTADFTLTGANFQTESSKTHVRIYEDVADTELVAAITSITPTKIIGTVNVTSEAYPGSYILEVTTVDGGKASRASAYSVRYSSIPTISAINPTFGLKNSTIAFTVTGTNFQPGSTTVAFKNQTNGAVLNTTELTSETSTKITGTIMVPYDAPTGFYRLDVITLDGGAVNKVNALRVDAVKAPTIAAITPTSGTKGSATAFTIMGANFQTDDKTSVKIIDDTTGTSLANTLYSVTSTKIIGSATVPTTAPSGKYRLEVTTTDGGTVSKYEAFTVNYLPLPTITSFTPASGYQNSSVSYTLKGANFLDGGTVVRLRISGSTINTTVSSVSSDAKTITGSFDILYDATVGPYRLDVLTNGGGFNSRVNAFTVKKNLVPVIGAISPVSGYRNTTVAFTLKGSNFQTDGTTVKFLNQSLNSTIDPVVEINPTIYSYSPTQIIGSIILPTNSTLNLWRINVTTVNGGEVSRAGAFTINRLPKPTITSFTPSTGAVDTDVSFTIVGTNFLPDGGTIVSFGPSDRTAPRLVETLTRVSPTLITGKVSTAGATVGSTWDVTVWTVDENGQWVTKIKAFKVV